MLVGSKLLQRLAVSLILSFELGDMLLRFVEPIRQSDQDTVLSHGRLLP